MLLCFKAIECLSYMSKFFVEFRVECVGKPKHLASCLKVVGFRIIRLVELYPDKEFWINFCKRDPGTEYCLKPLSTCSD